MRRIYPWRRGLTFGDVAEALRESELELAEVASCTFPGRPEPRSARWETVLGATVLRYEYLPDIELRYLCVLTPDFSLFADSAPGTGLGAYLDAELGVGWFDPWESLRDELHTGDHGPSNRAAAAFRVAAKARDDSVDGHAELLLAIASASARGPIAAAEQIVFVVRPDARAALDDAYASTDVVELRVHLRRALDRIDALTL